MITQLFISLMEAGYLPDSMIRLGIRHLLKIRLEELYSHDLKNYVSDHVKKLKHSPLAVLTDKANEQHYEVPTEYYDLCLGVHKKYSSCFWDDSTTSLNQAEQKALDVSIERADIQDGMRVLELGCGWGSLSLELARRFPKSDIVVVSNSRTQKQYIESKARDRGLNNLQVLTLNLGDEDQYQSIPGPFDRIMSIEMMEHLRNYEIFFKKIRTLLKPDGQFFVHIFTHKSHPYFFETDGDDNWMGRYFFSGGQMPSRNLFDEFSTDLTVVQKWDWNGIHYQKTLESWLQLMDQNADQVMQLFVKCYGANDAKKWFNRWRVFYMACSELFGYQQGQTWAVTHYLLKPHQ